MKSLTTKLMFAAAALMAANAASAQALKAEIPFAFHAGGKVMPAGVYKVDLHGLGGSVIIRDTRGTASVMALPTSGIIGKDTTARLVFSCSRGACSLVQAWAGSDGSGVQFKAPKMDRTEEATLTVIRLKADAAE